MTSTIAEEITRDQPLQNYYRPESFDQVWGHTALVASLKKHLEDVKGRAHAYLFTGPSGTGKTTLARIVAKVVGVSKGGLIELDGATNGKIEDIRNLVSDADYMPNSGKAKVYIIDECHSVTKAAWQAFLKSIEDCPKHVYYIFCTTEENKIPPTIKNRCHHVRLQALPSKTLATYGKIIAELEGIKLPEGGLDLVAKESGGSPRQFLNFLGQVRDCKTLAEMSQILASALIDEKSPIIRLANLMLSGSTDWNSYRTILGEMEEYGSSRAILRAYLSKIALGRNDWQTFYIILAAIEQMTEYPQEKDGLADLEVACWRIIGAFSKRG